MLCCIALSVAGFWLDQWRGPAAPGPVWRNSHLRKQTCVFWPPAASGHFSCLHASVNQMWQNSLTDYFIIPGFTALHHCPLTDFKQAQMDIKNQTKLCIF